MYQNKKLWTIAAIIGGLAAIVFIIAAMIPSGNKPTISLSEFNKISTGMTYEDVVEIIGSKGNVLSEVDLGIGSQYKTSIYMWDGEGTLGANANITFQNGKVVTKAQFGLK